MPATKIPTLPVTSSNIHAIGYDAPTLTLAIEFKNGAIWHYPGASEATHDEMLVAPSVGKFFNAFIKGKFTAAEKMTGPCPACKKVGWIGDDCAECVTQRYEREERAAK